MERLSAGDDLALNSLMQRWQKPLVTFLYRYTGVHEDALDLAQETFVRVYENRARYQPRAKFSTWLFTIAANLSRNLKRWRDRHPTVSLQELSHASDSGEEIPVDFASSDPTPDARSESRELAAAVRDQVQLLPHDLRTAVLLSEYEELPHAEIAEVLGCTPKAVETRLYRAREKLRRGLAHLLSVSRR